MANTFKLKTNGSMPAAAGTPDALYTVPASTTSVIIGLTLANNDTASITVDVKIVSTTVDAGQPVATQTNETVFVIKGAPIVGGGSLELMAGNKYILQAGDILQIDSDTSAKVDAILSIMEIT